MLRPLIGRFPPRRLLWYFSARPKKSVSFFYSFVEAFKVIVQSDLTTRYNIADSQMVACGRYAPENGHRECVMHKWGLIPSWAKDPSIGYRMISARAESMAEKPSFRKAFKHQPCLLLTDGFYEWKREGKGRQPYYIRFKDSRPFAYAGL